MSHTASYEQTVQNRGWNSVRYLESSDLWFLSFFPITLTPVSEGSTAPVLVIPSTTLPTWTSKFSFLLEEWPWSGPGPVGGTCVITSWPWLGGCMLRAGTGLGSLGIKAGLPGTGDSFDAPPWVLDPFVAGLDGVVDGVSSICTSKWQRIWWHRILTSEGRKWMRNWREIGSGAATSKPFPFY